MQGGTTQELQATGTIPKEDKENEDCFEFRLFSRPTWNPVPSNETAVAPVRIDIRSPSPDIREIGFLEPRRPDDYYFTNGSSEQERKQYQSVAVSGEDILRQTEARWVRFILAANVITNSCQLQYGCALPWRVITVKNFQNLVTSNKSTPNKSVSTKKTRQGKKRRILLRKRLALTAEKEAIARISKVGKEAAEREKKTRLNRAKKVRRKEKEKARKTIDLDKSV